MSFAPLSPRFLMDRNETHPGIGGCPECTELRHRLQSQEKKLAVIVGFEGMPGALGRIEAQQERSASSQGKRIGELEKTVQVLRETQTDTRARLFSVVATILSLGALGLALAKLYVG